MIVNKVILLVVLWFIEICIAQNSGRAYVVSANNECGCPYGRRVFRRMSQSPAQVRRQESHHGMTHESNDRHYHFHFHQEDGQQDHFYRGNSHVRTTQVVKSDSYNRCIKRKSQHEKHPILPWWKTEIVYQIYPRSFFDTNGDGTGDLKGITEKADYLKDLGIGAVWLSPYYTSPMADFGYDIANFTEVDPLFGTLADFDDLVAAYHKRGIRIIMDLVPNHSSDQHEWFLKSVRREDPYTDYYVWIDSIGTDENGDPVPPNNWLSVFRGSAWTWNEERQQLYLHQFLPEQPDLNFRNPLVVQEILSALEFWMERGIDGVRLDAIKHMFEVEDFSLKEPVAAVPIVDDPTDYNYLDHPYTSNQQETFDTIAKFTQLVMEYEGDRMTMAEVYDNDIMEIMKYYGNDSYPVSTFPFNFYFIVGLVNRTDVTGTKLKVLIDSWMDNMPEGKWPSWVLGNHDRGRVASRLGTDLVDSLNMLNLLLKGTPTTYFGEELGMEDTFVTFEQAKDPFALNFGPEEYTKYGRDPNRNPMQWNSEQNAGFSTATETWLPINDNYETLNVEAQLNAEVSHLKVYKELAVLRREPTFTHGDMTFPLVNEQVLTVIRSLEGEHSYLIVINTSENEQTVNLNSESPDIPTEGMVVIRSIFDNSSSTQPGSNVTLSNLSLLQSEGIVIRI